MYTGFVVSRGERVPTLAIREHPVTGDRGPPDAGPAMANDG